MNDFIRGFWRYFFKPIVIVIGILSIPMWVDAIRSNWALFGWNFLW